MRVDGNCVRIEAHTVNIVKLKNKLKCSNLGLEVREDSKVSPRILLHGVHTSLNKDSIRGSFIEQNLEGENVSEVKVFFLLPLFMYNLSL